MILQCGCAGITQISCQAFFSPLSHPKGYFVHMCCVLSTRFALWYSPRMLLNNGSSTFPPQRCAFYTWKHWSGIFDLVPLFRLLSWSSYSTLVEEEKRNNVVLSANMIDRQVSIIVSLTRKHLKVETGCWKWARVLLPQKKYTRMLSGGSSKAGLCHPTEFMDEVIVWNVAIKPVNICIH